MTWWKASSVTVTAGQSTVTVNTGDDIGMIKGAEGLVIGNQPPVEIKRSYLNASVMILELVAPWPYANQSGQPAIAFPTDGDLAAATAVLKQLINGFAIATELEMQQATNNVNPASAKMVKHAIDYFRPLMASTIDIDTPNALMLRGAFGLGSEGIVYSDVHSVIGFNHFVRFTGSTLNTPLPGQFFQGYCTGSEGFQTVTVHLITSDTSQSARTFSKSARNGVWTDWIEFYSHFNTTVDSNGFIKAASPIIKLFEDKLIKNGGFTANLNKVSVGNYLITGTDGFADVGWYIETPKDANGNIKVFVEYEQLADKTIVIKTYEPDYSNGKAAAGEPCDIPPNRWIDIRLKEPAQVSAISLEQ